MKYDDENSLSLHQSLNVNRPYLQSVLKITNYNLLSEKLIKLCFLNFFSDNHDNKFKALNAPEIFGSTFTHHSTIAFENVIFYFYAVGAKNNSKLYGSVFVHFTINIEDLSLKPYYDAYLTISRSQYGGFSTSSLV